MTTSGDQVNIVHTEQITHPWSSSMSCGLHYDGIGWITKQQLISDSGEIAFSLWCRKMFNYLAQSYLGYMNSVMLWWYSF